MSNGMYPHFTRMMVDGEAMYVPDHVGWERLEREHTFGGARLAAESVLWAEKEHCEGYAELQVGLGRVGKAFDEWRPYVILVTTAIITRVQLVKVTCSHCGWSGIGATTDEPDLYVSFGKDFAAKYREAQSLPSCLCVLCKTPMADNVKWCAQETGNKSQ